MRTVATFAVAVFLAFSASAQLTPGTIVQTGEPFPIIADFNGDGLDDLVQERTVILSDGVGMGPRRDLGLPAAEKVSAVLDVNADRVLDLITIETSQLVPPSLPQPARSGPVYRLYVGDASRQYRNPTKLPTGSQPAVGDVDGDGRDDILLFVDFRPDGIRTIATDMTVLRSRGDGTFDPLPALRVPASPQIYADSRILSGDIDHDGMTDLVIRCIYDFVVLRGTGGGAFTVESRFVSPDYGWWSTRLADIDGDSNLDVVAVGWRKIRIFFGDGHGGFARTTTTPIAKTHDARLPSDLPDLGIDRINQPRDIAIGHFTRADRNEIAAGMGEGDIVVFAWEGGALREVSRTPTEFWLLDIRAGSFRRSPLDDLYVMGTYIWGDVWPRPRLFLGNEAANATEPRPRDASRRRAASRPLLSASALRVEIRGECTDPIAERWVFAREGIFGRSVEGVALREALFDGSTIYFRFTAPFTSDFVQGALVESNGQFTGTAYMLTSCGWKSMTIAATPD